MPESSAKSLFSQIFANDEEPNKPKIRIADKRSGCDDIFIAFDANKPLGTRRPKDIRVL